MKKTIFGLVVASLSIFQPFHASATPVINVTGPTVINSATVNNPGVWGTLDYTAYNKYGTNSEQDYGDAPLSYSSSHNFGQVGNDKGQWQGLGTSNGINDGVLWSVGGSAFGTTADLVLGQEVTFKFLFWQANNGGQYYDQILAAFDFGQDGTFNNTDTILYQKIDTLNDVYQADNTSKDLSRYLEYTLTFTVPETMTIGSTWLRTRAHCSDMPWTYVTANQWLTQGETEDYQLNIVGAPVPEPATMLLFGTGLAALGGIRSRRRK